MDDRKFTPPTEFPAEYVDGKGNKAVILGRGPNKEFPFIGYDIQGRAEFWTEEGDYLTEGKSTFDLHDIPKRIITWHNVYEGWVGASNKVNRGATENRLCVYRIERDEDGGNPEIFVEEV